MPQRDDWAYSKAFKISCFSSELDRYYLPLDDVAKLLRAERARAVRVCQREKAYEDGSDVARNYNQACDDCATAIKGE